MLAQFTAISKSLDSANTAATKALAKGNSQPSAQVVSEFALYSTALASFDFNAHLITWPRTMNGPIEGLALRIQGLTSFLATAPSADATNLSPWFTQLHALAQDTQAADNLVRGDIGLAATTSYP